TKKDKKIYFLILFVLVVIFFIFDKKLNLDFNFYNVAFYITPFLILFVILLHFFYKKQIKKYYQSDKILQEEQELILSETGIVEISKRGKLTFSVEDFQKVIFGKKVISIFIAENKAILIPRHCFKSPEEENQIVEFIERYYLKR
ncbi:MAG: YcxB family protein, partial [Treponema sp.]|nr:YcxB family protein [Treponema sp.]